MADSRWRVIRSVLVALIAALAAAPAVAQSRQQIDQCTSKAGSVTLEVRIDACTTLIQSGRSEKSSAPYYSQRCWAYSRKGDHDRALQDCNEAIRLDPKLARAYTNRGVAYSRTGDSDHAIADYTAAIRLDPRDADAFYARGRSYQAKADLDPAIADYTQAIRLDPKDAADAYNGRGIAKLYAGSLPTALADLSRASELDPKNPYHAFWREIANRRSNLPSRLSQQLAQIDMTRWPAPLVRLFLGQTTPEAALAAADHADAGTKKGQVCEANFWSGELALARGAKDDATRLFGAAAAGCPTGFIEFDAARVELEALARRCGSTPTTPMSSTPAASCN